MEEVTIVDSFNEFATKTTKRILVITAYKDTGEVGKEIFKSLNKNVPVCSMNYVHKNLMGELDYSNYNLKIKLDFADILRKSVDLISYRYLISLDNIISSLKMLTELRITPDMYYKEETTADEAALEYFHELILGYDNYFKYVMKQNNYINNTKDFEDDFNNKVLEEIVDEKDKDVYIESKDFVICAYGFDVITPPQRFIFDMLKKSGYKIVHVINGEVCENFIEKDVNASIVKTHNGKKIRTFGEKTPLNLAKVYSNMLEFKDISLTDQLKNELRNKIHFYEFKDAKTFYEVLRDKIEENKISLKETGIPKRIILSANHKENVRMILEYDSSILGNGFSIKKFSLGVALLELYNLYSIEKECIVFNEKSIKNIFESGVIIDENGRSSRDFIQAFEKASAYFYNASTEKATDWIKACDDLIKAKEDDDLDNSVKGLGAFDIERDDLIILKNFFLIIYTIVRRLFFENKEKSLIGYFEVLKQTLVDEDIAKNNIENKKTYIKLLTEVDDIIRKVSEEKEYKNYKVSFSNVSTIVRQFLGVVNKEISDPQLDKFKDILKVENCEFANYGKYKDLPLWIIEFTKDNFGATKNTFTPPLIADHIESISKYERDNNGDQYCINNIGESLNIIRSQVEVNNHSLFTILKHNGPIVFVRIKAENNVDNRHYFEKKICKLLDIEVKEPPLKLNPNKIGEVRKKIKRGPKENQVFYTENMATKFNLLKEDVSKYNEEKSKGCPFREEHSYVQYESVIDNLLYRRSIPMMLHLINKKNGNNQFTRNKNIKLMRYVTPVENTSYEGEILAITHYLNYKKNSRPHFIETLMDKDKYDKICNEFNSSMRYGALMDLENEFGRKIDENSLLTVEQEKKFRKIIKEKRHGGERPLVIKDDELCVSCPMCHRCVERTFNKSKR